MEALPVTACRYNPNLMAVLNLVSRHVGRRPARVAAEQHVSRSVSWHPPSTSHCRNMGCCSGPTAHPRSAADVYGMLLLDAGLYTLLLWYLDKVSEHLGPKQVAGAKQTVGRLML